MKKILVLVLFVALVSTVYSQTADEVINKFVAASGGKEKLNAIKTLQYTQTITLKTPMGDMQMPMSFYREKNKLFRMDASMAFGPQSFNFFTLITDTAGYTMLPAIPMLGSDGGVQKMKDEERKAQAFQMDPAGMFAALVNYSAKGNKATLLKDEKIDDQDCFKLLLTGSAGDTVTYFINKANNMIARADTKGQMAANMSGFSSMMGGMANEASNVEVTALYTDYVDVKGIKFPSKMVIKNQMGDAESAITNIKVNEPIEAKWYKAQSTTTASSVNM